MSSVGATHRTIRWVIEEQQVPQEASGREDRHRTRCAAPPKDRLHSPMGLHQYSGFENYHLLQPRTVRGLHPDGDSSRQPLRNQHCLLPCCLPPCCLHRYCLFCHCPSINPRAMVRHSPARQAMGCRARTILRHHCWTLLLPVPKPLLGIWGTRPVFQ